MSLQSLLYEMNGLRVKPMTRNEIEKMALPLAKHLKFTKWNKARQRFDDVLENVATIVNLEILSETEWQADTFAEIILEAMGYSITQISLDFGRLEM